MVRVDHSGLSRTEVGRRGWYRGDCHVHSVHSDGVLAPQQLARAAHGAGLDFLATTDTTPLTRTTRGGRPSPATSW